MTTPIRPQRFRLRRHGTESAAPAAVSPRARQELAAETDLTDLSDEDDLPPPLSRAERRAAPTDQPVARISVERRKPAQAASPPPPEPEPEPAPSTADLEGSPETAQTIEDMRAEGFTARQLRMAMRVAQKYGLRPSSAHEAVLMLRKQGVDPFKRATMLDMVPEEQTPELAPEESRDLVPRAPTSPARPAPSDPVAAAKDRMARIAEERAKELRKVQRDIARRRRKRLALLGARLLVFVTLPTFIATWYFYIIATPMYATESQFIIQQADSGGMSEMGGLLPSAAGMGLSGQNEAASVQSYLQSRAAMLRLDREEGFRAHFQQDHIDILRRLAPDASFEAAFRLYKRMVQIGYDPTEGVVRMEVIAASPEDSERFARALIGFAEEHVDMMTQRLRDSQMTEARQSLEDAQRALIEARLAVVDLQEQSAVLSGDVEVSLLSQQIGVLEAELTQTRLSLQEMRSNSRPNPARLQPLERREAALRDQIDSLRGSMTRDSSDGVSLARTQSQLIMAEAEVQTREMMRAQAMQQMESARIEVSRQVRYLALSVEPVAPDEATYPRRLENSALAFLIFLGLYLFLSMTASVLREQVSG